jgi:hypothetical protein
MGRVVCHTIPGRYRGPWSVGVVEPDLRGEAHQHDAAGTSSVGDHCPGDPLGGHLFCFRGKRGDLIKLIWHDGQGACLFTKRLERGKFIWPCAEGGAVAISPAQLSYLLSGIDWRAPQETWRPTRV